MMHDEYASTPRSATEEMRAAEDQIISASFTLDVYGHVTDQMKQASAQRMNTFIKDVLNL